ncbi:MAG: DUF2189 domain-containing protein [Pseudolabrys sp.]
MAHSHLLLGIGNAPARIGVRRIGVADLKEALSKGFDDFMAMPSHAMFLCVVYPLLGLLLARLAFGYSVLPLLFPIASGFALVGPVAALGLYEMSRRREAGQPVSIGDAFDVLKSSSIGAIAVLSLLLLAVFCLWLAVANAIYIAYFGYAQPTSIEAFLRDVLTTQAGWSMMLVGNAVGFCFAVVVLTIGVVSFPLLLDRDVGAAVALSTSIRAVAANPVIMALWGVIVAALLVMGTLPALLGLTVVLPVLGHATWHLYRKVVDAGDSPMPEHRPPPKERRYAADFPVNLLRWR